MFVEIPSYSQWFNQQSYLSLTESTDQSSPVLFPHSHNNNNNDSDDLI